MLATNIVQVFGLYECPSCKNIVFKQIFSNICIKYAGLFIVVTYYALNLFVASAASGAEMLAAPCIYA